MTIDSDTLLAEDAVRAVVGGESGDRMIGAVRGILDALREMDADDREDSIGELADVDSVFPYTYDRLQAFAESIHHATYEDGSMDGIEGCDTPLDVVGRVVGCILYDAAAWLVENEV